MTEPRRRWASRPAALSAAGALTLALVPFNAATAQTTPEARSTDRVCDETDVDFPDIAGSAHADTIRCLADAGISTGLSSGDYGPRQQVTRGQMATFIARFIEDHSGQELEPGDDDRFDDVPTSGYVHSDNINALAAAGIVEGTGSSDGASFAPQATVTRAQMASFIARGLSFVDDGDAQNGSAPAEGEDAFGDDDGSVHEDNIDALAAAGVVQGFEGGEYRPQNAVLRDQMASFIMRGYDFAIEAGLNDVYETLTVLPAEDQEAAEGDDLEFVAAGLDEDETYRITLVDAANVARNDAGLVTFTKGSPDDAPEARTADAGPPEARITAVNGEAVEGDPTHTVGDVEPQGPGVPVPDSAALTFEVEAAGAGDAFVAVVYTDGGESTFLEVNAGGAPLEDFGVSGQVTDEAAGDGGDGGNGGDDGDDGDDGDGGDGGDEGDLPDLPLPDEA